MPRIKDRSFAHRIAQSKHALQANLYLFQANQAIKKATAAKIAAKPSAWKRLVASIQGFYARVKEFFRGL